MACKIFYLGEFADDTELPGDRDLWDATEDAEGVFRMNDVNLCMEEDIFQGCLDKNGDVIGASALHTFAYPVEGQSFWRFSVAVTRSGRRKGIARKLVQNIIAWVKSECSQTMEAHGTDGCIIEAWVVNEHMLPLLESLGFDGADDWSRNTPFLRLEF